MRTLDRILSRTGDPRLWMTTRSAACSTSARKRAKGTRRFALRTGPAGSRVPGARGPQPTLSRSLHRSRVARLVRPGVVPPLPPGGPKPSACCPSRAPPALSRRFLPVPLRPVSYDPPSPGADEPPRSSPSRFRRRPSVALPHPRRASRHRDRGRSSSNNNSRHAPGAGPWTRASSRTSTGSPSATAASRGPAPRTGARPVTTRRTTSRAGR
jgi:hypothetical protein